jgi:outer membrane lipoprotein
LKRVTQTLSLRKVMNVLPLFWCFRILFIVITVVGCSPTIPQHYLAGSDRAATFPAVKESVQRYVGTSVVWGGYIRGVRNTPEGAYVEIVESPLDYRNRPRPVDEARGRFLLLVPGFAEPARYAPGEAITVVGEVRGLSERPLGEITYAYPVVLRRYDRFWKPSERPDIHLGIGVGAVFGDH